MAKGDTRNRERDARAWAMRLAGASYAEIGPALGVTRQRARQICLRMLDEHSPSDADVDRWRREEVARLDRLLRSVWPHAVQGQASAVDRALRIAERRARLLGLDAPQRQEITGADGGPLEIDVGAALAAALARLG
jgi:hypothetical protein